MRLGTDALHVAPSIEWVPQGPFADYRNRVRTPGYALLGFTAGARVAEGIDAFLDVRNITGKRAIGDISAAIDVTDASAIYYPVERRAVRSEEHTSELQSLMRISYAVFCLKKKQTSHTTTATLI